MIKSSVTNPTRRGFLERAVVVGGVLSLFPRLTIASATETSAGRVGEVGPPGYQSLSTRDAAFTERLVSVLCPADHLTPNGVTCGLAMFIDRQLAGDFGRACAREAWEGGMAQSWAQPPLTQEEFFKAGILAGDTACQQRFGARFDRLDGRDAEAFLRDIAADRVTEVDVPLAVWFDKLVNGMLVQACFAGPIYDEYGGRLFWKLFGPSEAPAGSSPASD